jgi:hypothetical protein
MWKIAVLLASVPVVTAASETCFLINPQSVIDQAFVSALDKSSITHTRPDPRSVCYSEKDEKAVGAMRLKVHSENQQECPIFATSSDVAAVENGLIRESIRSWRENPTQLCYLARDGKVVRRVIENVVRK